MPRKTDSERPADLYGLVMAGGASGRMGSDKAELQYHGHSQLLHCFELLSRFCCNTYVSARSDQVDGDGYRDLPLIADLVAGRGPMGGVVSAMSKHPEPAWLVLACDLPLVDAAVLETLVRHRDSSALATAFVASDGSAEPLCAIYEPAAAKVLRKDLEEGERSLRGVLMNSEACLVAAPGALALTNVNTRNEFSAVLARLRDEGKALR